MITIFLMLLACADETVETTCDVMCKELVETCAYQAYPSYESCVQGCTYQQDQGGDIEGQNTCVEKAECDTFEIIDCEHKFGVSE